MATALVDLERLAVHSPRAFLARKNFQNSILSGRRKLRESWNFSAAAQGLALSITKLEQHGRNRRRIVMRAKKEQSRNERPRENRGPDPKFDSTDMMELAFGRLLGEDHQTTLAKVIGKKMNPDITYVKIEKEKELQEQKESAGRSSMRPSKFSTPMKPEFNLKEKPRDYASQTFEAGVPDLIPPPVKPRGFEKVDASPVQKIRVVPLVRSGGQKKSADVDPYESEVLIRKPMRVSHEENGLPPSMPEKAIIAPVFMRRKETTPVDIKPKQGDNLLRRPSERLNALGEPLTSNQSSPSTFVEDVQSADDGDPDDVSEEKFRQLLDGELNLGRQGRRNTISKTSVPKKVPPPVKPVLPSLEKKPSMSENPQLVESSDKLTNEPQNSTSYAGAESGSGLQDADVPKPQPKLSSRSRDLLSKPPLERQQTTPEVTVVNDVPSDKKEENIIDKVKTDAVVSLEEGTVNDQIAEASPDNNFLEDQVREVTKSLRVVNSDGEDTCLGDVGVQGSPNKEGKSEAVARKPVMRRRHRTLPLQEPVLSKDKGTIVELRSEDTDVEEPATVASDSASEGQEGEELMVREQGIKEQQGNELESTLPKTRQPAPGLKLSRPASPVAFTIKKDAQGDTTMKNLQRAISSFDEKRIIPNKKENDEDWARAEALRESKAIEELDIISTGRGGLLVGFGSLVGYLPAFELKAERRPVSFTLWAQSKGYDSKTKKYIQDEENQNNGGLTTAPVESATSSVAQNSGGLMDSLEHWTSEAIDSELLEEFKKERAAALSLLVGQKTKVIVISVERTLRQLRFSEKQAEGEGQELSQRKITLMESLNVGDVVTCQVKKITTFGAFVDLQGVPALIHSSELSWNRNIDPLSALEVGQEVKAKVCKLDRFLQRINLSLKLMQPDPLLETLESLVSPDTEVIRDSPAIESQLEENEELSRFIRKLERIPEVATVSRGRRVRGAALAPAFQIYLSGPLDNGYKLLARFGNEVQEVIVVTSVDRERMKGFIRDCTVQDN